MTPGSGERGLRRRPLPAAAAVPGLAAPTVLPAACASGPRPGCRGGRPGCSPVACRRPRARPPADRAWRLAQAACGRPALHALRPGPPVGRGQQGLPRRRRAARPQVPGRPGHRHPERQRLLLQPGRKGRLGELRLSDLPLPEGQIRRVPEEGEANPLRRRHGARLEEPHHGRRALCRAGAARPGRLAGRKTRARRLVGGPVLVARPRLRRRGDPQGRGASPPSRLSTASQGRLPSRRTLPTTTALFPRTSGWEPNDRKRRK